ncbi:APH(3')-I family aminoglycoside O-phosphotransferase [Croceibacterium sp. TMG7-5b_MA50]|uniref:APH(3')-I family aminoglycoside O-phosphotransferase n=1 Tax=Croceibacterium sp. TMG7-5b_MA50 TaxID=3121290 RepID=UPI00322186B2
MRKEAEREEACAAMEVPACMSAALSGYRWSRNLVGKAGAAVYQLHGRSDAPDLFLKQGEGILADDLMAEAARLRWMAGRVPAPAVVRFVMTTDTAWLLSTALPGETAYQRLVACPNDRPAIVDALAVFLRRLHAVPVAACPFSSDHAYRLLLAKERIKAGLVDESDFDEEQEGWTAGQVWDALQSLLPLAPDPVVTHGDFSLDNLLMVAGEVVGCIDVGRAGIGDRYQDLAVLWNCLGEFGADLQDRLFTEYAIEPDRRKLRFHLLLDELF